LADAIMHEDDAEFIAAATPAVLLALLDAARAPLSARPTPETDQT
jgi:hypothetical protein